MFVHPEYLGMVLFRWYVGLYSNVFLQKPGQTVLVGRLYFCK